jgi:Domain of unknown function (DUF2804), C-terminal
MPSRQGLRPLKAWRYVGVYGPEVMLCLASARIGPARQSFWAVWDRTAGRLYERTVMGAGAVRLAPGRARLADRELQLDLTLEERPGIETVCPSASSYAWTRKQGGVRATGWISIHGSRRPVESSAVIDDTAGYYQRHTSWRWSAGVGTAADGRALAWNLVDGVNDPVRDSERTLWTDGEARELDPVVFDPELTRVGDLHFNAEAVRERHENLLVIRSRYRQPFGTFAGTIGGIELAAGYGVMEEHDVRW